MGKCRKEKKVWIIDESGIRREVFDVGVHGLFQPQQSDIQEEMQGNEALMEYLRENSNLS
jgi:hypothetical protein